MATVIEISQGIVGKQVGGLFLERAWDTWLDVASYT